MFILDILRNHVLINALLGWLIAQFIKMICYSVQTGGLKLHRMRGDGGMPSCHSATVVSLALSAGLYYGFDSVAFAVATVLAIIVMHDAMGVRAEAGKHARMLNRFRRRANGNNAQAEVEQPQEDTTDLNEFLGHTPLQVFVGGIVGALVAIFFTFVVW